MLSGKSMTVKLGQFRSRRCARETKGGHSFDNFVCHRCSSLPHQRGFNRETKKRDLPEVLVWRRQDKFEHVDFLLAKKSRAREKLLDVSFELTNLRRKSLQRSRRKAKFDEEDPKSFKHLFSRLGRLKDMGAFAEGSEQSNLVDQIDSLASNLYSQMKTGKKNGFRHPRGVLVAMTAIYLRHGRSAAGMAANLHSVSWETIRKFAKENRVEFKMGLHKSNFELVAKYYKEEKAAPTTRKKAAKRKRSDSTEEER